MNIPERTGLIPSAGQVRRIIREYEEKFPEITIPKSLKKDLDRQYKELLEIRGKRSIPRNKRTESSGRPRPRRWR